MRERILLCHAHMSGKEMLSHEVALMLCAKQMPSCKVATTGLPNRCAGNLPMIPRLCLRQRTFWDGMHR